MYQARLTFHGNGHCQAEGLPGGASLSIDSPAASGGPGGGPNPIELLGHSLLACVAMTMSSVAGKEGINLTGMSAVAELDISGDRPRRVVSIKACFSVPVSIPEDALPRLVSAAGLCPIHNSFHPDTKLEIQLIRGMSAAVAAKVEDPAAGKCGC